MCIVASFQLSCNCWLAVFIVVVVLCVLLLVFSCIMCNCWLAVFIVVVVLCVLLVDGMYCCSCLVCIVASFQLSCV